MSGFYSSEEMQPPTTIPKRQFDVPDSKILFMLSQDILVEEASMFNEAGFRESCSLCKDADRVTCLC